MNKLLETIYLHYEEMPIDENLLETPKMQKGLNSFFNTYFGHFTYDEYDRTWNELLDIISAYQECAFEAGFYASVELMK